MFKLPLQILLASTLVGGLLAIQAAPAAGQNSILDRLSVHGFLSQAYGVSDSHQRLGIGEHGTSDYRTMALQFRYDAGDRDAFVVQFSHERLGNSPLNEFEPDVDLDYVFYQRRFGTNTTARVGKILSPIGIYNEFRDVGTLLPLYRPPVSLYGEQMYASETLDGVMVGQRVPLGDWSVEVEGFFGGWSYIQFDLETVANVDGALGGQVWLDTPVQGLRLGGAAIRYTTRDILGAPEDFEDDQVLSFAAVDGMFERFFVRGEGFHTNFGAESAGYTGDVRGYYGQAGVDLTGPVSLVAQAEFVDFTFDIPGPPPFSFDGNTDRDLALGLRYQPSPFFAIKLEVHQYKGYGIEDEVLFFGFHDPVRMTYGLISVSTAF